MQNCIQSAFSPLFSSFQNSLRINLDKTNNKAQNYKDVNIKMNELAILLGKAQNSSDNLEIKLETDPLVKAKIEEFYKATPVQKLFENQRLMTSWKQNEDSQLFRPETNAACIAELFKDAFPPPNLEIMDPLMENGESALRKYTDPNFFVIEWVQAMEKQNEEARKARREKRKNRKQQVGARQVAVKKNVAVMAKYVYDPNTGEKILVQSSGGGATAPQEITAAGTYAVAGQSDIDTNAMLAVPTTPVAAPTTPVAAPSSSSSSSSSLLLPFLLPLLLLLLNYFCHIGFLN